ncbi:MAG: hypothetical protein HYW24_05125 [Candidatus Aenigmarchaeota archaeon]|nr:hypothetical protein [Candidatus Aenigmarchaeota archaeon]
MDNVYSGYFSLTTEMSRRDNYAQEIVNQGFPILAMTYCDGTVLVTKSTSIIEKISPITSGIAFAAVGNYHHIRKIRSYVKNLTKKIGIAKDNNRSVQSFLDGEESIIDFIGGTYETLWSMPFQVDTVLVESDTGQNNKFYRIDFRGWPSSRKNFIVCGGSENETSPEGKVYKKGIKFKIEEYIESRNPDFCSMSLDGAVKFSIDALGDVYGIRDGFLNDSEDEVLHVGILEGRRDLRRLNEDEMKRFYDYLKS